SCACRQCPEAFPGGKLLRCGGVGLGNVQGRASPAFDPPIQVGTLLYIDPQAAVISLADVPADGLGVVPLECRMVELSRVCACHLEPEVRGPLNVGGLVDIDAIANLCAINACCIEKPQEEGNELGVTVDEHDALMPVMRLALSAFTPVSDGTG